MLIFNNYLIQVVEKEESCVNCRYYVQHYTKADKEFIRCFMGHCVNKRMRNVKPSHSCENFEHVKDSD